MCPMQSVGAPGSASPTAVPSPTERGSPALEACERIWGAVAEGNVILYPRLCVEMSWGAFSVWRRQGRTHCLRIVFAGRLCSEIFTSALWSTGTTGFRFV